MLLGLGVAVALGQSEVNYLYSVLILGQSDQEIVWFYISVDKVVRMDVLESLQHLLSQHENSLQRESA